jgi:tRNA(fMet)-specific endonuclease VapC
LKKALLDTDMLSEIGKAKDATVAANAKTYRRSFGHNTFSTVTVMEIVSGFQKTQATARPDAFLATLPHMEILPLDQPAAELAGRIAGDLERIGQQLGVADTMIAAIALESGLESESVPKAREAGVIALAWGVSPRCSTQVRPPF